MSNRETAARSVRRVMQFSWPRSVPIVQFPHVPLIVASVAGLLASMFNGPGHDDATAVSYMAITISADEEVVDGVNWLRHLLGLAYVVSTVQALVLAIRR